MPRYKLTLEYDGTGFAGWQRQEEAPSLQALLEQAASRYADHPVESYASGRTDAGVHALGQVVHVDITRTASGYSVMQGINYYLQNQPLIVVDAEQVAGDFHARFSATKRAYLYRIMHRNIPLALEQSRVWPLHQALNLPAMQEAAEHLLGHHDFTSFRSTECQAKNPERTLDSITLAPFASPLGEELHLTITSRSFLHHMVRIITGTLVQVGTGAWEPSRIPEILAAKDRRQAGPTAPASGLYFLYARY